MFWSSGRPPPPAPAPAPLFRTAHVRINNRRPVGEAKVKSGVDLDSLESKCHTRSKKCVRLRNGVSRAHCTMLLLAKKLVFKIFFSVAFDSSLTGFSSSSERNSNPVSFWKSEDWGESYVRWGVSTNARMFVAFPIFNFLIRHLL